MFTKLESKNIKQNFKTGFIYLLIVIVIILILFSFDNQHEKPNNKLVINNKLINNNKLVSNNKLVNNSKLKNNNKLKNKNRLEKNLEIIQSNKVNNTIEGFNIQTKNLRKRIVKLLSIDTKDSDDKKHIGHIKSIFINTRLIGKDSYMRDIEIRTLLDDSNLENSLLKNEGENDFEKLEKEIKNIKNNSFTDPEDGDYLNYLHINLIRKQNNRCNEFHLNIRDGISIELDFINAYRPKDSESAIADISIIGEVNELTNLSKINKSRYKFNNCAEPDITDSLNSSDNDKQKVFGNYKKILFDTCQITVDDDLKKFTLRMTNNYKLTDEYLNNLINNFDIEKKHKDKFFNLIKNGKDKKLIQNITVNFVFNQNIRKIMDNNNSIDLDLFINYVNLNTMRNDQNTSIEYKISSVGIHSNEFVILELKLYPQDIDVNYKSLLEYTQNKISEINSKNLNIKYQNILKPHFMSEKNISKQEKKLDNVRNYLDFNKITNEETNMKFYNTF